MAVVGRKFWWSVSREDRLRELRKEGRSYAEMAAVFGVSREAIAGKLRRLENGQADLEYRRNRNEAKADKKAKPEPAKAKDKLGRSTKAAWQIVMSAAAPREYKPMSKDEYDSSRLPGVRLEDLTGCRYPLTDVSTHLFCDAPRKDGSSYCGHHHSICQPVWAGSESERTAVKSAEWLVVNEKAGYIPA